MKTSFVSNITVQTAMRSAVSDIQRDLIRSQKEVVTGKKFNIGEDLGGITARTLNLHRDLDMMKNLQNTNSVVSQRLSASQAALANMSDNAQTSMEALIALSGATDQTQLGIAVQTLKDSLDSFTAAGNASVNGEYLFSGINTDVKPLADYFAAGSAAKTTFDTAFSSYFGFTQTDPNVATITPTQMDDFLTNVLEPMYTGGQWTTDWSSATDQPMTSRISRNEVVETSTTANETGFRKMAFASVVAIELINAPLNRQTRQVVTEKTIDNFGQAIADVDYERGQLGLSEARVKKANDSIALQHDIIETNINAMEGVDTYAASTRMTSLMNQMEISYNLTARISQLSLVNMLK